MKPTYTELQILTLANYGLGVFEIAERVEWAIDAVADVLWRYRRTR